MKDKSGQKDPAAGNQGFFFGLKLYIEKGVEVQGTHKGPGVGSQPLVTACDQTTPGKPLIRGEVHRL